MAVIGADDAVKSGFDDAGDRVSGPGLARIGDLDVDNEPCWRGCCLGWRCRVVSNGFPHWRWFGDRGHGNIGECTQQPSGFPKTRMRHRLLRYTGGSAGCVCRPRRVRAVAAVPDSCAQRSRRVPSEAGVPCLRRCRARRFRYRRTRCYWRRCTPRAAAPRNYEIDPAALHAGRFACRFASHAARRASGLLTTFRRHPRQIALCTGQAWATAYVDAFSLRSSPPEST